MVILVILNFNYLALGYFDYWPRFLNSFVVVRGVMVAGESGTAPMMHHYDI